MARLMEVDSSGSVRALDGIDSLFTPVEGWRWLDLGPEDHALVLDLAGRLDWARIEIEDVLDDTPIGKVIDAGPHIFAVFHCVALGSPRIDSIEVDCFLSENLLVTIRHGELAEVDAVWDDSLRAPSLVEGGPDRMMARLAAALVATLLPLLDVLEDRIEVVEDSAMEKHHSVIGEVQALRSDVTRLRRFVAPQREVMMALAREGATPLIGPRARMRFADVHEQLFRVVETLDGARLLLGSALETYRSAVAEEMNRVMKVLTVFSAIMLPLTLMAGVWGMNFENMPELELRFGYLIALGSMLVVGIGLWLLFIRSGFISKVVLKQLPRAIGLGLWQVATMPLKVVGKVINDDRPGIEDGGDGEK
jgi:magnesium transporter